MKIVFPEIEEMYCPQCKAITGHKVLNGAWICVNCETPLKNKTKKT